MQQEVNMQTRIEMMWKPIVEIITKQNGLNQQCANVFNATLNFIWEKQYLGACHSTSAAMYILLRELGLTPNLCIGEVRCKEGTFSHSWVELDKQIFDVAVSLPLEVKVGGPIFASIDLETKDRTNLVYGVNNSELDEIAIRVKDATLAEYSAFDDHKIPFWDLVVDIGKKCGIETTAKQLRSRYGQVKRTFRSET